jgi:phospholipid/cholesterol/gamma-HCH transport system permease protein
MATVATTRNEGLARIAREVYDTIAALGDLTLFAVRTVGWMVARRPCRHTLFPTFYQVGVRSLPVVIVTGTFIGMVLAVQAYSTFHELGLATRLGSLINVSIIRELGPALAATMLAGRIGSAMAAELATMRITEQVDALACLGVNPLHYLVVPRFLACVLLVPLLTIVANFMGVMGGALICIHVYQVDSFHYWNHAQDLVGVWDLTVGLVKPLAFGVAIALICCYRGLHSQAGAEGVGRAATDAFVSSFIAILALDFFLAMFLNKLHASLWPAAGSKLV